MSFSPGLLPRKPTDRRFLRTAPFGPQIVPAHLDLRPQMLTASNQGNSSKCAAYSMAGMLEHYNWKYKGVTVQIDPDPIYARAKEIDGAPTIDGTTLEAVLQASCDLGLTSTTEINATIEVTTLNEVQRALFRYGPVLAAFDITDQWSFASRNGWMPEGGQYVGGHAVVIVSASVAEVPNSVGVQGTWGDQGWQGFNRMTLPMFTAQFQYGLAFDFR